MPVLLSWCRFLIFAVLLNVTFGCGYTLTGHSTKQLGAAQTVWVPFFSNESVSPSAQTVLRRAFYEEFHALRGLKPAENQASADLVMKAKIISYLSRAVSYSSIDQAREFSLNINVELEVSRSGQTQPFWKGQIQGSKQYPANSNLALQRNAEEEALEAASRIIAHKFISAVEESY